MTFLRIKDPKASQKQIKQYYVVYGNFDSLSGKECGWMTDMFPIAMFHWLVYSGTQSRRKEVHHSRVRIRFLSTL